jgi:hypothetical protein
MKYTDRYVLKITTPLEGAYGMKRFLFLSSLIFIGLISPSSFAQPTSKAVDTSGPSPEQLTSEISKMHQESKKFLLNEAGVAESKKQQPQVISDTATPDAGSVSMPPPAAQPAAPNDATPKAPAKPQAPSSYGNDANSDPYTGFGTNQKPSQAPSSSGSGNSGNSGNSNKNTNWNMGY